MILAQDPVFSSGAVACVVLHAATQGRQPVYAPACTVMSMSYACTASSLKPLSLRYGLMFTALSVGMQYTSYTSRPTVKPVKETLYRYITPN